MATSVWITAESLGGLVGSAGGGASFDYLGWCWSALVVAGLMAFTVLIKPAGMVPAVWAAVVLSAQADPSARLRDTVIVAVVMTAIALGLFIHLLGFQARAFGAY